jgi:hypothetical protein
MTFARTLRTAYITREPATKIVDRDGTITVAGKGYRLTITTTPALTIDVDGGVSREGFLALGDMDERTGGAISAALDRAGHRGDAEQVRDALDVIRCGRGPIYAGEGTG